MCRLKSINRDNLLPIAKVQKEMLLARLNNPERAFIQWMQWRSMGWGLRRVQRPWNNSVEQAMVDRARNRKWVSWGMDRQHRGIKTHGGLSGRNSWRTSSAGKTLRSSLTALHNPTEDSQPSCHLLEKPGAWLRVTGETARTLRRGHHCGGKHRRHKSAHFSLQLYSSPLNNWPRASKLRKTLP